MNINLHIERLILEGLPVPGSEGGLIQAAVEAELARLLASEDFTPESSVAEPRITAGAIQILPTTTALQIGRKIGQSVFSGVNYAGTSTGGSDFMRRSVNNNPPQRRIPYG